MGKYIGYVILILIVLFAVEFFGIVDIPYFDIPDYLSGKEAAVSKTEGALEQLKEWWVGGHDAKEKESQKGYWKELHDKTDICKTEKACGGDCFIDTLRY